MTFVQIHLEFVIPSDYGRYVFLRVYREPWVDYYPVYWSGLKLVFQSVNGYVLSLR